MLLEKYNWVEKAENTEFEKWVILGKDDTELLCTIFALFLYVQEYFKI